jgi:hypothetical protein
MPVPISTTSFADIQNEFGGTIPISLSEYYNASGKFGLGITGIPISGQLSINNFRGKSKIINVNISGSGFTIITTNDNSNFNYIYFTNNSTFIIDNSLSCDIFMIGGGGGAGYNHGSGGGAGAYYYGINKTLNSGTYNIFIGSGGAGGTEPIAPANGGDSYITYNGSSDLTFDSLNVRCKGGGGGGYYKTAIGVAGGCGGGADGWNNIVGANTTYSGGGTNNTGTIGTGFSGGSARQFYSAGELAGGGGGGIGGVGGNASGVEGGNGGNGLVINIIGTEQVFGGGGGAGEWPAYSANPGGLGGGATLTNGTFVKVGGDASRTDGGNGGDAIINTGSGGGGGKAGRGGNGSSGLIVIRYKNNYNKNYPILKEERRYPPKLYDSSTDEVANSGELTGINPTTYYKETITINSYSNGYGIGIYNIYSSSVYRSTNGKKLLFNFNNSDSEGAHWVANTYTQPSGNYNSSSYIKPDYTGDWIIIKLPNSIILNRFVFYLRSGLVSRCPALWKCYGSNDGITFTEILEASNTTTALTSANYSSGFYEKIFTTFSISYLYIGFTIKKLVGGDANAVILNFNELQLFGKDDSFINPTAWYKFDDNTNVGLDSSGNGYHLTNNTNVSLDTTNYIKGTSSSLFNGTNNLRRPYTGNLFSDQSGWSLSFWVYLRKPTGLVSLVSTRLTDGATLRGFNLYINNIGDLSTQVGTDLDANWYYPISITGFLTDGINYKWYHYVLTMKMGEQKFYVNGILIQSNTLNNIPNFQNGSSTFAIGSASYGDFFVQNGFRYDDFRYYGGGRILTQAQVLQLYNGVS